MGMPAARQKTELYLNARPYAAAVVAYHVFVKTWSAKAGRDEEDT